MARTLAHISVPASLAGRSLHLLGYCSVFGAGRRCRSPLQCCRPRFSRPVSAPADIIQHIWRSVKESNLLRLFSPATAFQADPLPFRQRCMFMAPNGGADPHGFSATHSFRNWSRSRPVSFGIWPRSKGSNLSPLGQSQMCCLYTRSVWCERRATIPHASLSTRV